MFKKGDKVRVRGIEHTHNPNGYSEKTKAVGREFLVEDHNIPTWMGKEYSGHVTLSSGFMFHHSDLELIPEPAKFKVGDKVLTIGPSNIGTKKDRLGELLWYATENLSPAPAEPKLTKTQRIEALEARNTQLEKDITAVGDRLVKAQSNIESLTRQNGAQQKQIDALTKRCDLIQGQRQSAGQTEKIHRTMFAAPSLYEKMMAGTFTHDLYGNDWFRRNYYPWGTN